MQFLDRGIKFLSHVDDSLKPLVSILDSREGTQEQSLSEALMQSIVSQQLSTKVAAVIWERFKNLFPLKVPDNTTIQSYSDTHLRQIGLSYSKIAYIRNVSAYFADSKIKSLDWSKLEDAEIISRLTSIKGVGVWTVQMILIFHLESPDVWPVKDLGIQQSFARLKNIDPKDKYLINIMEDQALKWSPHRSTAALALWNWKNIGYPDF